MNKQNGHDARGARLLVVDDNDSFREGICHILSREGMTAHGAAHGEEAIKFAREHSYDLVLLDVNMPLMDGMQTLKILRKESPDSDFIMITGYQDIHLAIESIKIGAREFISKPIDPGDLVQRVKSALRAHAAEQRVKKIESEFSSRLLHDLRSPLHTVHSAISFLSKKMAGPVTDQQQEVLNHIDTAITKMDALLNDMIDISSFESGNIELQKLPTNIDELIPVVCARMKGHANAKNISLTINASDGIPTIEADPERIEQVVTNLVENAITYTPKDGTVSISLSSAKLSLNGLNRDCVTVTIADSGIGIPKEELPIVFDKYKEVLTGKESKQKTTGLGLAICKSIIDAHKGGIDVQSTPGKGTVFAFSLPIEAA